MAKSKPSSAGADGPPHVEVEIPFVAYSGLSGGERTGVIARYLTQAGFRFDDDGFPTKPYDREERVGWWIHFRQWWPGEPRPGAKLVPKEKPKPRPTRDHFPVYGDPGPSRAERAKAAARKLADKYDKGEGRG